MQGYLQECVGFEAKTECRVQPVLPVTSQVRAKNIPKIDHLLQDPPSFCCCMHSTKEETKSNQVGPTLLTCHKPWYFPISCCVVNTPYGKVALPCCRYLPKVSAAAAAEAQPVRMPEKSLF
jgi:hypothetical protein